MKERIEQLRELIKYHDHLYNINMPEISDMEYDELYWELVALEEEYPQYADTNSPTQIIQYDVVNELKKVKHEYQPMLSLNKTKDFNIIKELIKDEDWIAMLKLDGLTCRLTYDNGRLVRAETRGNGEEGEDITHNALVLPSIPKRISLKDTLVVDGEVVCDLKTFENFSGEYANPRNFAAGSIRLLDSKECKKRGLSFVAWDVIKGYEVDCDYTLNRKLTRLIDYGFTIVPFTMLDLDNSIKWLQDNNNQYCHYPIDGIVFKINNIYAYEALGNTDHHFRGGMAYKFYDEIYPTKLKSIEFTMGRTGQLTPVAIYEDVEIDGTTCNRASLHNLTIMEELLGDLPYIGQEIHVMKSNQIIPQIYSATKHNHLVNPVVDKICIPKECPICGGPLKRIKEVDSEVLICNNEDCEGRLINQLDHFASKKGLDIKGLSKATLEKLIDWGWINEAADLYHLEAKRAEWVSKPGFGQKSVDNILNAIEKSRIVTLSDFISAIGIPQIGKVLAKELSNYVESYEDFRDKIKNKWDFTIIDGIAIEKEYSILNFDYSKADNAAKEITYWTTSASSNAKKSLEGMTIVITGKLNQYKNRDLFINDIVSHGGKVVNSVSKNTTILINNDIDSNSSKNLAAKKLNIPIYTEENFLSEFLTL